MGEILKRRVLIILLFFVAEAGCKIKINAYEDYGGPIGYQTNILAAYATPNTVAPGDTARFVCIIRDSTNSKFKFYWYIPNGTPIGGKKTTFGGLVSYVTSINQIKWKAPNKPGAYDFEIDVNDSSSDLAIPNKGFEITVKQ